MIRQHASTETDPTAPFAAAVGALADANAKEKCQT